MEKRFALIIEDSEDIADFFSIALRMTGFRTEIVADGSEAMARLSEIVPDVIVLDLHLPGVMGGDILHHVRADPRLANAQVMIIAADARMAQEFEDLADLVLVKPVGLEQIRILASRLSPPSDSAGS